jgi:predicted adenine nucleotide alpha hydrolase (AANH) superfamily ATPase
MRPRLVLHICCAPDEAGVLNSLGQSRDIHCYFCNPNIQPRDEYGRRLAEARRVAQHYGVPLTAPAYEPQQWEDAIAPHADTPEGGARCTACFDLRLLDTARFCSELGWPAFATVMSISPHKRLNALNEAGRKAADAYGVRFEEFDFKKKGGFAASVQLSRELGLYRQDYCGCRLSRAERDERVRRRSQRA